MGTTVRVLADCIRIRRLDSELCLVRTTVLILTGYTAVSNWVLESMDLDKKMMGKEEFWFRLDQDYIISFESLLIEQYLINSPL